MARRSEGSQFYLFEALGKNSLDGQSFENFIDRIGFVADRTRAGSKTPTARAATIKANGLQLFGAASFRGNLAAVAGRAALRGFDRQFRFVAWMAEGMEEPADPECGHGYARRQS